MSGPRARAAAIGLLAAAFGLIGILIWAGFESGEVALNPSSPPSSANLLRSDPIEPAAEPREADATTTVPTTSPSSASTTTSTSVSTTTSSSTTTSTTTTTTLSTTTTAAEPVATIGESPEQVTRPPEGQTASAALVVTPQGGIERIEDATVIVLWDDPTQVVTDMVVRSEEVWAATAAGSLLSGTTEQIVVVSPATGLGYTALALTDSYVVTGTTSGAVLAFVRTDPAQPPRVLAGPTDGGGVAHPISALDGVQGESVRATAGGRVFLLSTDPSGIAVDCGPVGAASC